MGRDNVVPPHYRYPLTQRGGVAHANKPTPEREHASKQASRGKGAAGPHCPTTPKRARQHQEAQTPQANTPQTQTPNHPRANTPTTGAAPPARTLTRPRRGAWAKQCERKTMGQHPGMKQSRRNPHKCGHAGQAHTRRARKPRCLRRPCRPAPAQQGVSRERKADHNSPRQSAWVVVFVGVFADVCRRFWAGWFGVLGVFWGCLACFLVF